MKRRNSEYPPHIGKELRQIKIVNTIFVVSLMLVIGATIATLIIFRPFHG